MMNATEYEAYRQQLESAQAARAAVARQQAIRDSPYEDAYGRLEIHIGLPLAAAAAQSYKLAAARSRADEVCGKVWEDCQ